LGPIIKTENFKLEANYRRIGTDYRFVNQATQGASDQEGFFLLTEYRPWQEITLDPATLPEDSVHTSPEELRVEVSVGGELKDMDFLIHVKPRPIMMGPPKK
jgi:hypothetical protein